MSLEAEVKELREAIRENSELLKVLTSKAKSSISTDSKDEGEEEKPKTTRTRRAAPKKEKAPTVAAVKKAAEDFLDVDDEDEYAERRKIIKKLTAKYGAAKMTEIEEGKRAAAIADMEAYKNGDEIDFGEEDEDDDI